MSDFVLTEDTYYSADADRAYMSVHQYLDFVGGMGIRGCESKAMAKLNGEYEQEKTDAMYVGSFVDCYFEGTLDKFKADNPQIFTQKGELKAQYKRAEKMIARCEQDDFFMQTMGYEVKRDADGNIVERVEVGEHQTIFTAYLFGCDWKCKLDTYIPDVAIIDLKTTANLHNTWRVQDYGVVSFVEYFGYITQLAVYQKIVEINTGKKLPCYISAVTKEDTPEIEVIYIDQESLDHALNEVEMNMPSVLAVKNGEYAPVPCGKCDYCKGKKVLKAPINYKDLIYEE